MGPGGPVRRAPSDTAGYTGNHVFVTGVDFPEGYDWRRDTTYGVVRADIILFMDGEPVLKVPAGGDTGISSDPDRHHFIGGHVYTDHVSGSGTIISSDGTEAFRYEGAETLRGMLLQDRSVITLGQSRSGKGFSLRKDGEQLLAKSSGEILGSFTEAGYPASGALYLAGQKMCFSYHDTDGWHFVEDGTETVLEGDAVYDMRIISGKKCAIVRTSDSKGPVLMVDGMPRELEDTLDAKAEYRFCGSGSILFTGVLDGGGSTVLWDESGIRERMEGDCSSLSMFRDVVSYVRRRGPRVTGISQAGDTISVSGDWVAMTPQCISWRGSSPLLALTPTDSDAESKPWSRWPDWGAVPDSSSTSHRGGTGGSGGWHKRLQRGGWPAQDTTDKRPALWAGSEFRRYDINGFLTGVCVGN